MKKKSHQTRRKIFILDDHPMIRRGMAEFIRQEPDLTVCGEAADAYRALTALQKAMPDLILVDLSLPGKSGLEFIKESRQLWPELNILVVSMHDEAFYAERVLRAGGRGYLMKSHDGDELIAAIRKVLSGDVYVSKSISKKVFDAMTGRTRNASGSRMDQLTDREVEVLSLIGQAKESRDIAKALNMSLKTVEVHRSHIRQKLGIRGRAELIQVAVRWMAKDGVG